MSRSALKMMGVLAGAAVWGACSTADDRLGGRPWWSDPSFGIDAGPPKPPGGALEDEQFPPELLEPYAGPPIDVYDNTGLGYRQLKARIARVFADTGIGGDTESYFAGKSALLGGADFAKTFTEARVLSTDFLLAVDAVAKDSCARAVTNKTGPFAGIDVATITDANRDSIVTSLYERVLFRPPSSGEVSAANGLVSAIGTSPSAGWSGLCEALVRHPDALFTLPPSVQSATGPVRERLGLVKLAFDLVGRPPTDAEITQLSGKSVGEKVDALAATTEFRDFFYHRARVRLESVGTPESDEAARLWAFIASTGAPMQELLTADYTVDEGFAKKTRPAHHGKTGVLTMPGFIKTKQGLPHYNYSARVMSDFMGQIFEVTPAIVSSRVDGPASSTVAPGSSCFSCHSILTPLAMQRLKWADDGTYRERDESGQPIDDSDRGLVPIYPYKGAGMESFAVQAVRKEKFFRQTFQALYLFFLGRHMRYAEDERTVYLELWNRAYATNGNVKELIKVIANIPGYLGNGK
jgi:hypothetical protein